MAYTRREPDSRKNGEILHMPAKGEIKRDEFLRHLKSWANGSRFCRISLMGESGEPLLDIVKAELKNLTPKMPTCTLRVGSQWQCFICVRRIALDISITRTMKWLNT